MSTAPKATHRLADEHRATLLQVAAASVRHGLTYRKPSPITLSQYDAELQTQRATFITLRIDEKLRGCIGSLFAQRPLVTDVAENAYAAAFRDRRFSPLTSPEFSQLNYHISVLHPPEQMQVESQADLLAQIRPNVDGLILEEASKRATFLPDVWETLPAPDRFLSQLIKKGGWSEGYWSPQMKVSRYTTEGFG